MNLSHFIGAVHRMENIMGRGWNRNPLRSIASERNLQDEFNLWYILMVMGLDDETGEIVMMGDCTSGTTSKGVLQFGILGVQLQPVGSRPKEGGGVPGMGILYRTRMAIDNGGN
ncbi:LOW QUALITY PROTEIN: hypothetical protein ACHAW5_000605 [Stephanodiscus triporus]|uniref:Uncharacterized protein n=1 Tax=Stephanodiscus triporus TaxID=2934178 RepID=A0ABD3P843_9STRA